MANLRLTVDSFHEPIIVQPINPVAVLQTNLFDSFSNIRIEFGLYLSYALNHIPKLFLIATQVEKTWLTI